MSPELKKYTPPAPEPKKPSARILSMDEIRTGLSDMAQNGEGAQRAQAYRMLMNMEQGNALLPEPMGDHELTLRLARMMKGSGVAITQMAYQHAFPNAKDAAWSGPKIRYADATPEMIEEANKITSLKLMNRRFPAYKQHGVPKGFPSGRSAAAKADWCRQTALKIMVETLIREREIAHQAMKASDEAIRGGTDASPQG